MMKIRVQNEMKTGKYDVIIKAIPTIWAWLFKYKFYTNFIPNERKR